MVTSGTYFNGSCCFDYGNAETNNTDDGAGTMEAVYFGNWTAQGKGAGNGPWVMADMENGVYAQASFAANATGHPLTSAVCDRHGDWEVRDTLRSRVATHRTGTLSTPYDGVRPNGYSPMKKRGPSFSASAATTRQPRKETFTKGS